MATSIGHEVLFTGIDLFTICARAWIRCCLQHRAEYVGRRRIGRGERDEYPIRGAASSDSGSL